MEIQGISTRHQKFRMNLLTFAVQFCGKKLLQNATRHFASVSWQMKLLMLLPLNKWFYVFASLTKKQAPYKRISFDLQSAIAPLEKHCLFHFCNSCATKESILTECEDKGSTELQTCPVGSEVFKPRLKKLCRKLPTHTARHTVLILYASKEPFIRTMMDKVHEIDFTFNYSGKGLLRFQESLDNDQVSRQ